ncbi:phage tail protein [Sphingomonas sp. DT-204]|uniref:phage tail protein n=1 Tax=Sphingomonas sp. DT-204 TaxID=3396166 RepID=UPI003F1DFCCC
MADQQPESGAQQARVGAPVDPYRNYNFLLTIQDVAEARFTECMGLGMRIHPIRYRESGAGQIVRALPGPVEYAEVTLRYGLTSSIDLWNWLLQGARGTVQRRHVSIVMLESDGVREAMRWNLINAWPCQWSGAPLDALGRETAIEELHLAFDSLDRG